MGRCPKCGFKTGRGKTVLRIWCTEENKKRFYSYSLTFDFDSLQDALISLLEKAEKYDKLTSIEKARAYVETPSTKPS